MQVQIANYISALQLERGRSPLTIESYESTLKSAAAFFCGLGRCDWLCVTTEDADRWLHDLGRQAPRTLIRKLAALRGLARYLVVKGAIQDDFTAMLIAPKLNKLLPRILADDDAKKVVEAVDGTDQYSVRNRAILELFYGSGLSVSELCNLSVEGVYFRDGFVHVTGRCEKERITDLSAFAVKFEMRNPATVGQVANFQPGDFGPPGPMEKKHRQNRAVPFAHRGGGVGCRQKRPRLPIADSGRLSLVRPFLGSLDAGNRVVHHGISVAEIFE